ncbi:MAG: hypothetical protein QNL12_08330 [Acidimicrobiia bacterium]|nr:hypothetical protein [Acidimicrobiia bacterium]MDX2467306.1 hypothetical protein [Acidimicrobiia bacterium]
MDLDDFARGAVASLLTDQVDAKTGLVTKVTLAVVVAAVVAAVAIDGVIRWLAMVVIVLGLALALFVFISKRLALGIINRLAPAVDLAGSRQQFDSAIAEADLPMGPVGFLRLIWRLRKGVGPEVERLGAVVTRLKSELD